MPTSTARRRRAWPACKERCSFLARRRSRCHARATASASSRWARSFPSRTHSSSRVPRTANRTPGAPRREFALLGEILASFEWGALDLLLFDLPPGAERTVQYADYLGPRTSFVLVTIPSEVARGVVARSVAALAKGPNRILGYVENMSGYYCRECNAIKPLFASPEQPAQGLGRSARRRRTVEPADSLPRYRALRSGACRPLRPRNAARSGRRHSRRPLVG